VLFEFLPKHSLTFFQFKKQKTDKIPQLEIPFIPKAFREDLKMVSREEKGGNSRYSPHSGIPAAAFRPEDG